MSRMKMMMVGEENVGKTTLVHHLSKRWNKVEDEQIVSPTTISTDGIQITNCVFKYDNTNKTIKRLPKEKLNVDVSFWDFAGQELYYTTHQFFLSKRSIFIAVWNMTRPIEESRVEYWLFSISSKIPNSIVFVVGTHYDEINLSKDEIKMMQTEQEERFSRIFPNIQMQHHYVSCKSGHGINVLKTSIEEV